jgi:hypothetical protein
MNFSETNNSEIQTNTLQETDSMYLSAENKE